MSSLSPELFHAMSEWVRLNENKTELSTTCLRRHCNPFQIYFPAILFALNSQVKENLTEVANGTLPEEGLVTEML